MLFLRFFAETRSKGVDEIPQYCYFNKTLYNRRDNALVAQLAEHIHGKDKVISSILIEG